MAPKAEGGRGGISTEAFLAACIKHSKEKVNVNFDALAKEIGMSVGGAANKFRGIMKQLGEEGASWANKDTNDEDLAASPVKTKTPATNKRKTAAKKAPEKIDNLSDDQSELSEVESIEESPKKKSKTTTAKAKARTTANEKNTEDGQLDAKPASKKAPKGRGAKAKATAEGDGNGLTTVIATHGRKKDAPQGKDVEVKHDDVVMDGTVEDEGN